MLKCVPHELWHGNTPLVGDLAGAFEQLSVYLDRFRRRCSHAWILSPTDAGILRRRTHGRWKKAGLRPLGFHEGRHTFASIGIAAGLNPKTLSTYLGHATITITLDRYGHLMPGSEVEARAMLDAYLEKSEP